MKKIVLMWFALLCLCAPTAAQTGDVQVFGVTIGKPIEVPECPLGRSRVKYGEFREIIRFCWADTSGVKGDGVLPKNGSIKLKMPPDEWPGFVSWGELKAWIVDGVVEGVSFAVHNTKYDLALTQFVKKFGPPQSKDETPVANRMGAVFDNTAARWSVGSIRVSLVKRSEDVEMGSAQIISPKADDYLARRYAAPREGARGL